MTMMIGLDIEGFRRRHGLTYRRLASMFGVPSVSQMRRYAIGAEMLRDERLERVLRESRGEIDLYAIHQRHCAGYVNMAELGQQLRCLL